MTGERRAQGLLDPSIILHKWVNPSELPAEMAISAITLAGLSADPPCAATTSKATTTSTQNAPAGTRPDVPPER